MCQPKFLPVTPRAGISQYAESGSKKRKAAPSPDPTETTGTGTCASTGGGAGAGNNSRTRALTLEELQENFHLPINEVASKLGVCVTVLKQQCRELGIVRWPYRKVRKLDNMLVALESAGPSKVRPFALSNGEEERLRKITTIKRTLRELIADPNSCAHLKLGKVKGLKADGDANSEAAPCSPTAEKATSPFEGNDSLAHHAAAKGVLGVSGSKAKAETESWQFQDGQRGAGSSKELAAGTLPRVERGPLSGSESGDPRDVMEAASALIWGLRCSKPEGDVEAARIEAMHPSRGGGKQQWEQAAEETTFLGLLEGSLASVPREKDDGVGPGEGHTSRAAVGGEDRVQEGDAGRPLSFPLGPSRHSGLASSCIDLGAQQLASRGWLSSYMPSSSRSPDKGPCLAARSPGTPAHSAAAPSADTAHPSPHEAARSHPSPCHEGDIREGSSPAASWEESGPLGDAAAEAVGCAVELDLISRLESTQDVPRPANAWAPKAGGGARVEACREVQLTATVGDGSPSPRLASSTPEGSHVDKALLHEELQRQQQAAQTELLPPAHATAAANLVNLATDALLLQPMLLLESPGALRGVLPQPPKPAKTSSPLFIAPVVLPVGQLAGGDAFLQGGLFGGYPGLSFGGASMPSMHADALSLSRQHLALQRQQQAHLMMMLAGSSLQASAFDHPSLASLGQGSESIVDVLMAQHVSLF